jgi:aminopeptidase N
MVTEEQDLILPASSLPASPSFTLTTKVLIRPEKNSELSGLYKSGPTFCSQCEAEGFRRITYYLDRPDVMATFRARIEADKAALPLLLSNGNKVEEGELPGGRHYAVWEDPFPKPSYLFAVVAGKLASIKDSHTTPSGRRVALEIFSEPENVDKLEHAMRSLKRAMEWDERVYGLEYHLDVYNIVAVNDFNAGAMENTGLNIFNTAFVLAKPSTATDGDYERIEGVIGHEVRGWVGWWVLLLLLSLVIMLVLAVLPMPCHATPYHCPFAKGLPSCHPSH